MPDSNPTPISGRLRELIEKHGRPLTEVALEAGVEHQPLWRWFTGRTEKYDVDCAEKVWVYLTGKDLGHE